MEFLTVGLTLTSFWFVQQFYFIAVKEQKEWNFHLPRQSRNFRYKFYIKKQPWAQFRVLKQNVFFYSLKDQSELLA